MINKSFTVWLGSFLLALASGNLSATQVDPVTIDEAIRDAGFIFQGTVTKIESRLSTDMGSNYDGEYYAFVTFRIERIIKGEVDGNGTTFTLPFESCLTGDPKKQQDFREQQPAVTAQHGYGMGCGITGMPHFKVGDSDILFVGSDYAGAMCPLVGWGQGRYSIVNNKIYPVTWLTKEGDIDDTAPYGLEDEQEAEKRGEVLPQEAKKHHWKPMKGAKRMGPDDFTGVIERKLRDLEKTQFMAGKLAPKKPVKSADFNDPFYYRSAKLRYEERLRQEALFLKGK
ncbi:hypothetical protein [Methyloglobulus sp.]|uniref:hypothetical protein n=1 Tax=Methyloglobulus sp. TaxID=2518622 RepID=UPI0032B7C85A